MDYKKLVKVIDAEGAKAGKDTADAAKVSRGGVIMRHNGDVKVHYDSKNLSTISKQMLHDVLDAVAELDCTSPGDMMVADEVFVWNDMDQSEYAVFFSEAAAQKYIDADGGWEIYSDDIDELRLNRGGTIYVVTLSQSRRRSGYYR